MARAQRPKPKDEQAVLVLELGGMTLVIDTDSFTIPESAKMSAAIRRIVTDAASGGVGVESSITPDITVACAAYVVALRQDPTLTFEDWFDRFSMRDLQEAVMSAKPAEADRPEA